MKHGLNNYPQEQQERCSGNLRHFGCLYADVRKTDFRSKWSSKNNFTELDTIVFKGERFNKPAILDIRTHFKPTETSQYTNFSSCHPPGVRKGFIKGEALRLLRTNPSAKSFVENINQFKACLRARDYPDSLVERITSKTNSAQGSRLFNNDRECGVTFCLSLQHSTWLCLISIENILMSIWHLIQNQPSLRGIYKEPPIVSYKKGKSLGDILVRAKL